MKDDGTIQRGEEIGEISVMKILLLAIIAITFSGCATKSGGSDWDEWCSRLKKDTPSTTQAQGQADSQDWAKHNYGQ